MTDPEYRRAMMDAAESAAQKVLIATGNIKPFLTQIQAYKMYGRGTVDRWIKEGLITPIKDGGATSRVRIDRLQIEAVARTSNRASYFEHLKE